MPIVTLDSGRYAGNMRLNVLSGFALVLTMLAPGSVWAQDDDVIKFVGHAESMAGVTRIRVVVEDIPTLRNVLPAAALKEAAEAKLRNAGIDVDAASGGRLPWLYINVAALETARGYVYSVQVCTAAIWKFPRSTSTSSSSSAAKPGATARSAPRRLATRSQSGRPSKIR